MADLPLMRRQLAEAKATTVYATDDVDELRRVINQLCDAVDLLLDNIGRLDGLDRAAAQPVGVPYDSIHVSGYGIGSYPRPPGL
ncbi:hypothetical protein SEA_LIGMA_82 [Gordonia phage Ligma]|nr:hypothetical protein SEA_LIGMA_82 [Gordonia phage Ligma]UQT02181.1 hypothetical protein SEA_AXUMITE_82 [Gordonia phage Axumite]